MPGTLAVVVALFAFAIYGIRYFIKKRNESKGLVRTPSFYAPKLDGYALFSPIYD
jgi:hypothetical protein